MGNLMLADNLTRDHVVRTFLCMYFVFFLVFFAVSVPFTCVFFRSFPFCSVRFNRQSQPFRSGKAPNWTLETMGAILSPLGAAYHSDQVLSLAVKGDEVIRRWTRESQTGESFEC